MALEAQAAEQNLDSAEEEEGMVEETEEEKSLTYDFCAVDIHWGGLGGGHHTDFAEEWYGRKIT